MSDVLEAVSICDIVYDDNTVSTAVVRRCESAEALLAGGIPLYLVKIFNAYDLQLDNLIIEDDCLNFLTKSALEPYEIDSDRVEEVLVERIFLVGSNVNAYCVPKEKAGLAYATVPDQEELE